ncbi:MAG: hypothetical protein J5590_09015 [Clostridia bacterium]|nr:hypothetical protein [Clostridia bacterium]
MSNFKAVLITTISFVISGITANSFGLNDTAMIVVFIILWVGTGLALAWFQDEIPGLKNIR